MPEGDKCFKYSEKKYTNNNNDFHYAESSQKTWEKIILVLALLKNWNRYVGIYKKICAYL